MTIEEEIQQSKFSSAYEKLALNLLYSTRWLEAYLKTRFSEHGLTMQQYNILRILRGSRAGTAFYASNKSTNDR
ncbi:hypothetical protein [Niabella ginsengisoli]|uniref:MarR family transcriptional regulator n=1 Tax=Niabella ginsengisoli TaxID=522298 RepID=A0ABS9SMA4_9BACT|nr:hypothetical protein [Niabella ginsengisoli]MCH5599519.1 hypothetical protein [Niabella ginsengisoli]